MDIADRQKIGNNAYKYGLNYFSLEVLAKKKAAIYKNQFRESQTTFPRK